MAAAAQTRNLADRAAVDEPSGKTNRPAPERRREPSSISFPYVGLDDVGRERAVFGKAGTVEIDLAQAANALGRSPTSSSFRGRIAGLRLFGLVDTDQGRVRLTPLGRAIAEDHSAAARVTAFLRTPLYQHIKANHHGRTLPKPQAFAHELTQEGVAPKQATRARQISERSAKHAGFLAPGSDRFVEPILEGRQERVSTDGQSARDAPVVARSGAAGGRGTGAGSSGGSGNDAVNHPFVQGLLATLPPPGAKWPVQGRIRWLRTAAGAFDLMYEGEASIKVEQDNDGL